MRNVFASEQGDVPIGAVDVLFYRAAGKVSGESQ